MVKRITEMCLILGGLFLACFSTLVFAASETWTPDNANTTLNSNYSASGKDIVLSVDSTKIGSAYLKSNKVYSGDFEVIMRVKLDAQQLANGQNRSVNFGVVSNDPNILWKNQAYIGIYQKTAGYASTDGNYSYRTDMCIGNGWGRFNNRNLNKPQLDAVFKITRQNGVINTYFFENCGWVKLGGWGDGFKEDVNLYISAENAWEATVPSPVKGTFTLDPPMITPVNQGQATSTDWVVPSQDYFNTGKYSISGNSVSLEQDSSTANDFYAYHKKTLTGDFEITASIEMPNYTKESAKSRSAIFYIMSDEPGKKDTNQAYIALYQKIGGYAPTDGAIQLRSDMMINGGWGRFNSLPLQYGPNMLVKIARKNGVIKTYYMDYGNWIPLGNWGDGFSDRVKVYFYTDTLWENLQPMDLKASFKYNPKLTQPENVGSKNNTSEFTVPPQDYYETARYTLNGNQVSIAVDDKRRANFYAQSNKTLSGDFDVTASINMQNLPSKENAERAAIFYLLSDEPGNRDKNQVYVSIYQKDKGYAATGGKYMMRTDMMVNGGWGHFNNGPLVEASPKGLFRIARKDKTITVYYNDNGIWKKLGEWGDGFTDKVRVHFYCDTTWESTVPSDMNATFIYMDTKTPKNDPVAVVSGSESGSTDSTVVTTSKEKTVDTATSRSTGDEKNALDPPTNVNASLQGGKVLLKWTAPKDTDGVAGYKVYRSDTGKQEDFDTITDFAVEETQFIDDTVESGAAYFYTITTVYESDEESARSGMVTLTVNKTNEIVLQLGNPSMKVNGLSMEIDAGKGSKPQLANGVVVMPVKALVEAMGGTVTDNTAKKKTFTVNYKNTVVEFTMGSKTVKINGNAKTTATAPAMISGRPMIPLKVLMEALGAKYTTDNKTKNITIKY